MNFKRFFYIFLALIIALSSFAVADSYAATKKKTKAKSTAVSKNKGTAKKKSSTAKKKTTTKSTKKKTSSTSKKKTTTKKKRSKKKRATSKKKRRATSISHKQYVAPVEVPQNDTLTLLVNEKVIGWIPENMNPGGLRVNSVKTDAKTKTAKVSLNENFTYLPVTSQLVADMKKHVESILPDSISDYYVSLNVGTRNYSYYITTIDKLPEQFRKNTPFVLPAEPYVNARKGMEGDIVAVWPSHGRYFKPAGDAWMWQRPQLFQVTEDTYTMGYIYPFAVPMIENAGAYVLLPRERDTNVNEVIVDNDTNDNGQIFSQPYYKEMSGTTKWETGEGEGFIYDLPDFRDTENPFENGTYRQTTTVSSSNPSVAAWYADIPEDGEYAVYVSYKSLPESTEDARYTINYSGGSREFRVNQTMGGGTWIYLGTFPFEEGFSDTEPVVTLSNISSTAGKTVTADAIKIGGGMGNIARSPKRSDIYIDPSTPEKSLLAKSDASVDSRDDASSAKDSTEGDDSSESDDDESDESAEDSEDNEDSSDSEDSSDESSTVTSKSDIAESETVSDTISIPVPSGPAPVFKTSGLPRFLEGARYWMQWAGIPEYIYSPYHGTDDYKDDYTNRGHWVNYLAGGSRVLPNQEGLGIPVDAAFALHSDAGKREDDSIVGTLGIYYTNGGDSYIDGTSRSNSRSLTDMLMRQITGDIRQMWEPNWTRRQMWDKSYVEARVPEVPTTLIELMSHQNFADMKYGLDPAFRFTVSRSIYKAIGRFIAERKDRQFVVQPLPVKDFSIQKSGAGLYRLSWQPTTDRLEPTAKPSKYLVFERTADELGFHLLGETTNTYFIVKVVDHDTHSFKIVAANEGGLAFPSEILALREGTGVESPVLIVNGFTRVSGPENFTNGNLAGFRSDVDFGVPYIKDISFIGYQTEFNRKSGEAFGRSNGSHAAQVIAGNTFDYPYLHGEAIAKTGRGFVSTSVGAVIDGSVNLSDYMIVDLILGKQKVTVTGNGNTGMRFTAFPTKLQKDIKDFTHHGGKLMVSGQYVVSDLYDYQAPDNSKEFAAEVLGIKKGDGEKPLTGQIKIKGPRSSHLGEFTSSYSNDLNDKMYIVENPDDIAPSGKTDTEIFMTFPDTGQACGIFSKHGKSKTAVMSVPFESIKSEEQRDLLMRGILDYLAE